MTDAVQYYASMSCSSLDCRKSVAMADTKIYNPLLRHILCKWWAVFLAFTRMDSCSITIFVSLSFCHVGASLFDRTTVWVVGESVHMNKEVGLCSIISVAITTFVMNIHGQFSYFVALNVSHGYWVSMICMSKLVLLIKAMILVAYPPCEIYLYSLRVKPFTCNYPNIVHTKTILPTY